MLKQNHVALLVSPYIDRKGKPRLIEPPQEELKVVQKRIKQMLGQIDVPDNVFSGIKGRSYSENALMHIDGELKNFFKIDLTAFFAAAAALSMVGALCMPMQASWRQMPALQSPWFAPHVTSYVISYGFLTVSAILALASCFGSGKQARLRAADEVVMLSFPFLTFGLWSGALWADVAWARYWAWDIKEAWALITWCVYLLYFHLRGHASFASWCRPLLIIGFVAVLVTFFVVNLLPSIQSIHSYAQ